MTANGTGEITRRDSPASTIERVLIEGNLAKLTPDERVAYYNAVCSSLGLNPLTRPFEYLTLNGKLILYARKDCTEQLRKLQAVSITQLAREITEGVYVVTATATDSGGRTDQSIGAVPIDGLKGDARANAMMKAETKAKRRVTLSLCGLGMLDETELELIPNGLVSAPRPSPRPALAAGPPSTPLADKALRDEIKRLSALLPRKLTPTERADLMGKADVADWSTMTSDQAHKVIELLTAKLQAESQDDGSDVPPNRAGEPVGDAAE